MLIELNEADFLATVNHGMVTCLPGAAALSAALDYGDLYAVKAGEPTYCTSARSAKYTHMLYSCARHDKYLVMVIENESDTVIGHFLMTCDALLAPHHDADDAPASG